MLTALIVYLYIALSTAPYNPLKSKRLDRAK